MWPCLVVGGDIIRCNVLLFLPPVVVVDISSRLFVAGLQAKRRGVPNHCWKRLVLGELYKEG